MAALSFALVSKFTKGFRGALPDLHCNEIRAWPIRPNTTPANGRGLLSSASLLRDLQMAIGEKDPALFYEHSNLYWATQPNPTHPFKDLTQALNCEFHQHCRFEPTLRAKRLELVACGMKFGVTAGGRRPRADLD